MEKPLQKFYLDLKSVLIQCLDADQNPIPNAVASGFIRQECNGYFLYTCWHVVTGYELHDVRVTRALPNRKFLKIALQDAQVPKPGVTTIGGLQTSILPLYDMTTSPHLPLWYQDDQAVVQPDLNAINIRVPFWHDAVKIPLPSDIRVSDMQVISDEDLSRTGSCLTDKVFVVGFPYGFSAIGDGQPTPVVLTRYIAAIKTEGRRREVMLESIGAPGMSGGPVFIQSGENVKLFGMYTGLIYPDHVVERNDKTTALGTCVDMLLCWEHMPLVLWRPPI